MSYPVLSIANAFLERAKRDGVSLSNMKLQKLLYFAEGHSHALRNQRLIKETPEAWDYGPVYPAAYREFRRFGARPIGDLAVGIDDPVVIFRDTDSPAPPFATPADSDVNSFLNAVWNAYKGKTALQLSDMSHVSNGPWARALARARENGAAGRNAPITYDLIAEYFRPPAKAAT